MDMSLWAAKRRLIYFLSITGFLLFAVGIPLISTLYTPPSCFDAKQNQGEAGVDCGGSCARLCPADALPLIVHWERFFEVAPTVYNTVAYVENPNSNVGAFSVPYIFKFYDEGGVLLYERTGKTNIPPKKKFAIFEHSVTVYGRKISKVMFEFTESPQWDKRFPQEPIIPVTERTLIDETTSPKLFATIVNPFIRPIRDLEVTALIFDTKGNVIAVSQTFIDEIPKDGSEKAIFTWIKPFPTQSQKCEMPADIVLAIDRSGSMDDDGLEPPQPLTDVKNAAISFVDRIKPDDQVSVISFATGASVPPDSLLTSDIVSLKAAIANITIRPTGSQFTNISDGLDKSLLELLSDRHKTRSKRVAVLLTDGIANVPEKEGEPKYSEEVALDVAQRMKSQGVDIYSIGLGANVNREFLRTVATEPDYFYIATTSADVADIYRRINSSICKIGPAVIEIITRSTLR